jgi:hypothetical protein
MPSAPIAHEIKTAPATTANEVWVNTRSGKYWKPGSRYLGKAKQGEFMSELDALDADISQRAEQANKYMQRNQKLTK